MKEIQLSNYCRWNYSDKVSKFLNLHSDLDLKYDKGICFNFAIEHDNINMLTLLLNYYTQTKLQAADQDSIEYKLANFKLRNILQDALKAFEVSTEMQKILDPYTSVGEDTIEEDLSSFDEAEFANEAFPNEGSSSTAATVQYDGGELTEELLSHLNGANSNDICSSSFLSTQALIAQNPDLMLTGALHSVEYTH